MNSVPHAADSASAPPKPGMAQKWLVAILVLTFAFVLMPFLLWYMTTFTRPLNDADLATYFQDTAHPRRAQHALSQIADRIMSPNPGIRESAKIWYPEVIKFSEQGSDELRVTSAWVMGQDNQSPEFHAALLKQLADANPMVQRNAALVACAFRRSFRPRPHRGNAHALHGGRAAHRHSFHPPQTRRRNQPRHLARPHHHRK